MSESENGSRLWLVLFVLVIVLAAAGMLRSARNAAVDSNDDLKAQRHGVRDAR